MTTSVPTYVVPASIGDEIGRLQDTLTKAGIKVRPDEIDRFLWVDPNDSSKGLVSAAEQKNRLDSLTARIQPGVSLANAMQATLQAEKTHLEASALAVKMERALAAMGVKGPVDADQLPGILEHLTDVDENGDARFTDPDTGEAYTIAKQNALVQGATALIDGKIKANDLLLSNFAVEFLGLRGDSSAGGGIQAMRPVDLARKLAGRILSSGFSAGSGSLRGQTSNDGDVIPGAGENASDASRKSYAALKQPEAGTASPRATPKGDGAHVPANAAPAPQLGS